MVLAGLVAAAALLPALGKPGLWEPQELAVADSALARVETAKANAAAAKKPAAVDEKPEAPACSPMVPPDATSRSLPRRALEWVLRDGPASEGALRRPMAVLGVLTVMATAGIAARLAGARAALLAALFLLSFPLLVMQARQLTSELATAAGAALTLYGLLSLRPIGRTLVRSLTASRRAPSMGRGALHLLDDLMSLLALAAGLALGFLGGGALLGVLVPLFAFAAVSGLGSRGVAALGRLGRALLGRVAPRRWRGGESPPPLSSWIGDPSVTWLGLKGLAATVASLGVLYVLVDQAYKLGEPTPGTRQIFGHAILPTGCYSWALGGVWQAHDDLRVLYDSSVEQIAFGTYPWGLVAPLAVVALLMSRRRPARLGGALCLAWAAVAWVATEAFQRKVGHTIYAGFPALALAVALWLDAALTERAAVAAAHAPLPDDDRDDSAAAWRARVASPLAGRVLLGLFFVLGALTLGKDLQTFPERLSSLLLGDDAVKYPQLARFLWIKTRVWVLAMGIGCALATALWLWAQAEPLDGARSPTRAALARRRTLGVALALTAALAAFWSHGWQSSLSRLLSSKSMFATYRELRKPGDPLLIYGDLGNAPRYYADGPFQQVHSREEVINALAAPSRAFALVPASELCSIHRLAKGPYAVLDNDNPRTILLSNRADGGRDHNPLANALYRREPPNIATRPSSPIILDDRIEIVGWKLPKSVARGDRFEVTFVYRVLAPLGGTWKVFLHFDRGGGRFIGDHEPIQGRCPTSEWQTGDYIVDRHTVLAGAPGLGPGEYQVWTGLFTGQAPSWRNMKVKEAPGKDDPAAAAAGTDENGRKTQRRAEQDADRVKIGTIQLR